MLRGASAFSTRSTFRPCSVQLLAVTAPAMPEPMTSTSVSMVSVISLASMGVGAVRNEGSPVAARPSSLVAAPADEGDGAAQPPTMAAPASPAPPRAAALKNPRRESAVSFRVSCIVLILPYPFSLSVRGLRRFQLRSLLARIRVALARVPSSSYGDRGWSPRPRN